MVVVVGLVSWMVKLVEVKTFQYLSTSEWCEQKVTVVLLLVIIAVEYVIRRK